jgi:hypothetical protein
MDISGKALKQKAVHEFKELVFITLYLFVFLWLFLVYKSMVLQGDQKMHFTTHGLAFINAVVLAKFMLVARSFRSVQKTENTPLIYPTLLWSAIFAIFLLVCKVLEEVVVGHFHGKSVADSIAHLTGDSWKPIIIWAAILFVVLIPLTAFGELERVVGEEKLHKLFLRPHDPSKPFGQSAA